MQLQVSDEDLTRLAALAWAARENAHLYGKTKVGCAVMADSANTYVGCNVEHIFRSHDVHAEVNAITTMVAAGDTKLVAVFVVAERERFTPCGACMDWIYQFGGGECVVGFQGTPGGPITSYRADELMPFYPM